VNEWSYTSTPPTCLHGMNRGNLSDIRPWWDYITSSFAAFHITFKYSPTIRYWTSGDIIPCSLVDAYQCLGEIHCLQGFSLLKTEGAGRVIPIYQLQGIIYQPKTLTCSAVAYQGGGGVFFKPPPPKFRRPSKIVPNSTWLLKLLKIAEFRMATLQDVQKKGSKILKLPKFAIDLH